ncbi:MAG: hypothetical protein HHJ11_02440 [Phycicoccus sp.]|nr:hypothetical protein [Phycicoccus sp.]NMM32976.1 hypothetical protein [Phycicoccus sp.]
MTAVRRSVLVAALVAAVVAVVASAAVAVGAVGDGAEAGHGFLSGSRGAAPKLPGTVVNVSLANMGGSMMGSQGNTMMGRGAMRLIADHTNVPHGTVSFLVTNSGSIDEAGSLGEASKTDGEGAGEGIVPGASGWMSITLAPGDYELACNLAGHYTAGMFTQLTVS